MAKPRYIIIGCPQHGYLNGPYKTTVIHIGSNTVENIVCALCPACGIYYTTAMAITLGIAEDIDGIPVRRGRASGINPPDGFKETVYESHPEIKKPVPFNTTREERRAFIHKQKQSYMTVEQDKNTRNNEKPVSKADVHEAKTKKETSIPQKDRDDKFTPCTYILTDRDCVKRLSCPKCASQLSIKRYNIPVYTSKEDFSGYYTQNLLHCSNCNQTYMTDAVYEDIQEKMKSQRQHINPSNVRLSYLTRDDRYLYEPIAGFDLYFERTVNRITSGSQMTTLAQSSFLKNEGYNIRLSDTARHQVLRSAVFKYGRRRVADHLRFLIATREGQRDGRTKYANAIRIWQDDLNYVARI